MVICYNIPKISNYPHRKASYRGDNMTEQSIFKGKITLNRTGQAKKCISFNFVLPTISLDQVVMHGFKEFNFQDNEKRELSSNHRRIIRQYQHLCPLELTRYSNELINIINSSSHSDKPIEIEASDAGTFICLTAIYSGKIKKECEIIFNLSSSPLRLFPKNLAKSCKKSNNIFVKFIDQRESWFSKLDSISKRPVYIKLKNDIENEELLLIG